MIVGAMPQHAEVLAVLHKTSFTAPWQAKEFETLLSQPGVAAWISQQDDVPMGFILVRAVADEAEILTLAVAPEQRRKGVAQRLLQHTADILREGRPIRLFLEVAADNIAARTLYMRSGFAVTGERKGYYAGGIDAVTMTRTF